jgi:hypothetical protein
MFVSQSRAGMSTHDSAAVTPCHYAAAYYNKMKGFADEMAAAGKPLEDEDFISYVLAGLDQDYNLFVKNMTGKEEISLGAIYSQFLAAEARLELTNLSKCILFK